MYISLYLSLYLSLSLYIYIYTHIQILTQKQLRKRSQTFVDAGFLVVWILTMWVGHVISPSLCTP